MFDLVDRVLRGYTHERWTCWGLFLAVMVVLVFGNVVLRYAFNSGLTMSEEVSRWLFCVADVHGRCGGPARARPPGH